MKMNSKTVLLVMVALCMAGCQNQMASCSREDAEIDSSRLGGAYVLNGTTDEAKLISGRIKASHGSLFGVAGGIAAPISLAVDKTTKDVNGALSTVNNLMSLCTLCIWPWVNNDQINYAVKVSSPTGNRAENFSVDRRSWFSLIPIAWIPVPGWADWRSWADDRDGAYAAYESEIVANIVMGTLDKNAYEQYRQKQEAQIAENKRIRNEEQARIAKRRGEVEGLLKDKKWDAVMAACNEELSAKHPGGVAEDVQIWRALKASATSAKDNEAKERAEAARKAEAERKAKALAEQEKGIRDIIAQNRRERIASLEKQLAEAKLGNATDDAKKKVKAITVEIKALKMLLDGSGDRLLEKEPVRKTLEEQERELRRKANEE